MSQNKNTEQMLWIIIALLAVLVVGPILLVLWATGVLGGVVTAVTSPRILSETFGGGYVVTIVVVAIPVIALAVWSNKRSKRKDQGDSSNHSDKSS